MDMHLEDTSTASKLSDAKSSIFKTFNELRKWRENQLQRFREKQLMEQHSLSQESGKKLEQFLENNKDVLFKGQDCSSNSNLTASESTFHDQDSSISGHILRCFSDASQDDSAAFQQKLPEDAIASRRPVKDGYNSITIKAIPESIPESLQSTTDYQPQSTLRLKPAIVKSSSPPRKVNRVQFKEPDLVSQHEAPRPFAAALSPDYSSIESNDGQENTELVDDKMDKETAPSYEDLLAEKRELDEFEILESCAQNSSFNSDSSVVQKVLLGEPLKRSQQNSKVPLSSCSSYSNFESRKTAQSEFPMFSSKVDNYVEDIPSRKKHLQNYISDIDTKIASLQREVSNSNKYNYLASEVDSNSFCSTPVKNQKNDKIVPEDSDCDTPQNSPSNSIICPENKFSDINDGPISNSDSNALKETKISMYSTDEKECGYDEDVCALPVDKLKSKLREKMQMLEKEIKSFQTENAQLAVFAKERDEVLRKLKKEQEEFLKYKDEEKKKLKTEIESERQQLKRQKETFNRFQKLRSDNPGRKEREEITTLRQEAQKLQEELKKQRVRFNKDTRRLKNQLMAAENERDGLKLDNIALEDQVQDLLAILKGRNSVKKKLGVPCKTTQSEKNSRTSNGSKEPVADQDVNQLESSSLTLKGISSCDKNSNSSSTKQKVRFNLVPDYNSNREKISEIETLNDINADDTSECAAQSNNDVVGSSSEESESEEPLYEEFNHGDKVERVYASGEKEIMFTSGTLKHISADGKTIKISYHNGDVKEIFPDKREVYTYVSGVIEKHFPYGLEVTVFPGGQIQKIHPDGLKEVKFPDGTVHFIHCNGSQEILAKDGIMVRLDPDGTETVEFPNGEREIRKDDYKRREYPDGSVKTVYDSGRQETRYANGRIRIKDKSGKLLVDTKHLKGLAGKFS